MRRRSSAAFAVLPPRHPASEPHCAWPASSLRSLRFGALLIGTLLASSADSGATTLAFFPEPTATIDPGQTAEFDIMLVVEFTEMVRTAVVEFQVLDPALAAASFMLDAPSTGPFVATTVHLGGDPFTFGCDGSLCAIALFSPAAQETGSYDGGSFSLTAKANPPSGTVSLRATANNSLGYDPGDLLATINIIPEPSTALLLGLGLAALAVRGRRVG